ncbi:DUF952 domain-containing protein [Methyloligella sp. 2.7D]|uniref:DUF952 domain-containing protein n=1 Tax=unclassified Methyloligella TaxID=2625955 RepID=UPI00157D5E9C|nr:DUF952 domain-containing protein [Methyloligella sp. GL2]QKP78486.1 DUF952 domain-containing protein [Methyloligella sp. GL2]
MSEIVYKITESADLASAEESGALDGSADDLRDGFIHLSFASQVPGTLERHFTGQNHLMLLAFDAKALGDALRFEPSRGGEMFPHLYGSLPLEALLWSEPLAIAADGSHPLSDAVREKLGLAA